MYSLHAVTFEEFRAQARLLVLAGVSPSAVTWMEDGLFGSTPLPQGSGEMTVPAAYMSLAKSVACHADAARWGLLYEALWRIQNGEPRLLDNPADALTSRLNLMAKQVGRDIHKTHAFVRFKKVEVDGQDTYLAWHCPDHRILRLATPFFVKRFRNQRWGIATPQESCSWDGAELVWGDGFPQSAVAHEDDVEKLWRTYYRHIFNPARIKIDMMKREMPVRHWRTLPETQDIPAMLQEAEARVAQMMQSAMYSSDKSLKRAEIIRKRQNGKKQPERGDITLLD